MKVSIIGGGGRVGSDAAYALQCGAVVDEIVLVDVNKEMAAGEALDLLHGSSFVADQRIFSADYDRIGDSDVVCVTAGLRRKPDESRLALVNRNVELFSQILESLRSANLDRNAILFVVSNPVDILTRMALERLDWQPERVVGLGTVLDTARFRSLIAQAIAVAPTQVKALILGEHGDSMVPIWSSAGVEGLPLTEWPGINAAAQAKLFERTKDSGAECLRLKGGSGRAVGISIREVIHSIALDQNRVLPVSTRQVGKYGLRDVAISVPTVVGRNGWTDQIELQLWPKETAAMRQSASVLAETYRNL
jgi:L-lactate dehydrogenase